MKKTKILMKKAWLISWRGTIKALGQREQVVAILDSRLWGKRIREYTELLYVKSEYSLKEKILYAKKKLNIYPAEFGRISGVRWEGQVFCGGNPFLYARHVQNLKIEVDEEGKENLTWDEIASEQIKKIKELHKELFAERETREA